MKKLLFLFAILFFGIIYSSNAKIKVYGKITGYDGKPTKLAHIAKYGDDTFAPLATADSDGNYSLFVDQTGINTLAYFGTFHFLRNVKFFIPPNAKEININVQLPPIVIPDPTKLQITGDFNNFNFQEGLLSLKSDNGKYYVDVPNNSDTLKYQLVYNFTSQDIKKSFNGSQADYYVKDGGSDFKSVIISKGKNVRIEFDPSKYASEKFKSSTSSSDSITEKLINQFISNEKLVNEYKYSDKLLSEARKWDSTKIIKQNYVDSAICYIKEETNKYVRAFSIMALFNIASYGQNMNGIDINKIKKYAKELISTFDYKNSIWETYYSLFFVVETFENPYKSKYLSKIINSHPSSLLRETTLCELLYNTEIEKYKKYQSEYFEKYQKLFPNGKHRNSMLREFSQVRNIEIGKQIPDFKLPLLENLRDTISPKSLIGKYTLIDVWGIGCLGCRLDMPNLDSAYTIFKDKNFNILSIAFYANPEMIQNYRKTKWKMPWTHAIADASYDDPIADAFQINSIPFVFLIDPEGKIIETDFHLRGERLIPTLQKYLK